MQHGSACALFDCNSVQHRLGTFVPALDSRAGEGAWYQERSGESSIDTKVSLPEGAPCAHPPWRACSGAFRRPKRPASTPLSASLGLLGIRRAGDAMSLT